MSQSSRSMAGLEGKKPTPRQNQTTQSLHNEYQPSNDNVQSHHNEDPTHPSRSRSLMPRRTKSIHNKPTHIETKTNTYMVQENRTSSKEMDQRVTLHLILG